MLQGGELLETIFKSAYSDIHDQNIATPYWVKESVIVAAT